MELGKNNQLVFHLKKDMDFFRRTTMGHSVVMGSNTFKSIGKPLVGRKNFVVSRHPSTLQNVTTISDIERFVIDHKEEEVFVIGGASIYEQFLPYADTLYLTEINAETEADTFFPYFDKTLFRKSVLEKGSENGYDFEIIKYQKIKS